MNVNEYLLDIDDIQIDNQLVRQNDAIILKKQKNEKQKKFISFNMQYVNNEDIENFYHFKVFFLDLAPFDLNLDGSFCDEFYKYVLDVSINTKRSNQ